MKIAVVGTGYVGLVSGACFADKGFDVCCVDVDSEKIDLLNSGGIPIYEPGLKLVIDNARKRDHIVFTTDLEYAVKSSSIIFICVGTPEGDDGNADLKYVYRVAEDIGKIIAGNPSEVLRVVVDKSTVPVGTADRVKDIISRQGASNFSVASVPEFLKEGSAIDDFMKPDRVVIGVDDELSESMLVDVFSAFVVKTDRIIIMDIRSAELTKYAANSMLALRITFMNQMANLCERVGADVNNVRRGIGSDSRIGPSFLFSGPGYGGSCFPKDVKALIQLGLKNDFPLTIIEEVDKFNEYQKKVLAEKVIKYFSGSLSGKTIAVWGLAFKPQTDDVRESPAISVIGDLIKAGAKVQVYDPEAQETFKQVVSDFNIVYSSSMYDAVGGADALVIVTDWNEFRMPDFVKLKSCLKNPVIFDGRNLYDFEKMGDKGFKYFGIGRK